MRNKNIEFIFFDVGGVAILDFSKTDKWNEMLDSFGLFGELRIAFEKLFDEYERLICCGVEISEFVNKVNETLDLDRLFGYDLLDEFVSRFEVNSNIEPLIQEISREYRIGLLTNMYPNMLNLIDKYNLLPKVNWEVIIDSSVEGCAKPSKKIYEIAQKKSEVSPEMILFVENSINNIEAARDCGWNTFLYDPAECDTSNEQLRNLLL